MVTLPHFCRPFEFAAALGINQQAVSRWISNDLPNEVSGKGRVIPTMEALQWLSDRKRATVASRAAQKLLQDGVTIEESVQDEAAEETFAEARRRKEVAQADREELRVAALSERLVDRKQAFEMIDKVASQIKKGILKRAAPRIAPLLVGKEDVREISAILTEELRRVME